MTMRPQSSFKFIRAPWEFSSTPIIVHLDGARTIDSPSSMPAKASLKSKPGPGVFKIWHLIGLKRAKDLRKLLTEEKS